MTASLHYALGLALMRQRRFADAAMHLRQCLEKRGQRTLTPVNAEIQTAAPQHCLALCLVESQQPKAALEAFAAGLKAHPHSRPLRLDWANFQFRQGQPIEALQTLHQLIAEDPQDPAVWKLGGEIALSRKEFLEFAGDWTGEAIRHHPQDAAVLAQRAEWVMLQGDYARAAELWSRLPAVAAHDQAAWTICHLLSGGPSEPRIDDERAVSRALIESYQRWLSLGAVDLIRRLNASVDPLEKLLPSAAQCLHAALAEAAVA